jgi:hypothetical protein
LSPVHCTPLIFRPPTRSTSSRSASKIHFGLLVLSVLAFTSSPTWCSQLPAFRSVVKLMVITVLLKSTQRVLMLLQRRLQRPPLLQLLLPHVPPLVNAALILIVAMSAIFAHRLVDFLFVPLIFHAKKPHLPLQRYHHPPQPRIPLQLLLPHQPFNPLRFPQIHQLPNPQLVPPLIQRGSLPTFLPPSQPKPRARIPL